MLNLRKLAGPAWLAVGLLLGLVVGGLLPHAPLHAVATDRLENFAIATGHVDDQVEAIYFLDVLTGTLKAGVLSNQTPGFQTKGEVNLNADLMQAVKFINARTPEAPRGASPRPGVQYPSAPNYVMVTGVNDLRRGAQARTRPSASAVYVAETNTGIVMAYILHWDQHAHSSNTPYLATLKLWAFEQFTTAMVRNP